MVESKKYSTHIYNFNGDQVWNEDKIFGDIKDVGEEGKFAQNMVVVKVNGNLTIGDDVTVSPYFTDYGGPKGFTLYVSGRLINHGTIENSHGAYAKGENVYLLKNGDETFEYVPEVGGSGALGRSGSALNGTNGIIAAKRATGGGGAGGGYKSVGGSGAAGTSYSGGSGGGAGGTARGFDAEGNGGKGGDANSNGINQYNGSGAGNPGGYTAGYGGAKAGSNATGGLLVVYADIYQNEGEVKAEGSKGGYGSDSSGGSSGGGSVNIFYNSLARKGDASAEGGETAYSQNCSGGAGGTGTITYTEIPKASVLTKLKVNGEDITDYSGLTKDYTYTLNKYDSSYLVEVESNMISTDIIGNGRYFIEPNETQTIDIILTNDFGYVSNYTLTVNCPDVPEHNSKLKRLNIEGYNEELNPYFHALTNEYTLRLNFNEIYLNITTETFDNEAEVEIEGNNYIPNNTGTITITVKEAHVADTVYVINYTKVINLEGITSFGGGSGYQEYTVPMSGTYRISLWGASGGGTTDGSKGVSQGGAGGYTSGEVKLEKGTKLYFYIGENGGNITSGNVSNQGLYTAKFNGGGAGAFDSSEAAATGEHGFAGGGATDVRIVSGIGNAPRGLASRIMVAAGGGGGGWSGNGSSDQYYAGGGGAAGGLTGYTAPNSDKLLGATQTSGNAFGYGGNGIFGTGDNNNGTGGGGGGYYGGINGTVFEKPNSSGGGGSSYISGYLGSIAITSENNLTPRNDSNGIQCIDGTNDIECSYHYSGLVFNNAVMLSGLEEMPSKSGTEMTVGNFGDGFATIEPVLNSKNNFLNSLVVTNIKTGNPYTLDKTFDPLVEEYHLSLTADETEVEFGGRPGNDKAIIEGLGVKKVIAGENVFEIKVTSESGDERTYKVIINRPASTVSTPKNIIITGLVDNLCNESEGYCTLSQSFDPDVHNYRMKVPSGIRDLEFTVDKFHEYQEVIGEGVVRLQGGINMITIEITAEAGVDDDGNGRDIYTYEITRDMTGNNYIDHIDFIDPELEIGFHHLIQEYYFKVDNDVTSLDMDVILDDIDNASYEVFGNEDFGVGNNVVEIVVTASNGDERIYTLNVYRLKNANALLDIIRVKNGDNVLALNPEFQDIKNYYTLEVPYEVTEVNIEAIAQMPSITTVNGGGIKQLKLGKNQFIIDTVAQDNITKERYTVVITRLKNNNNYLKELTVTQGALDPIFSLEHKEIDTYRITVNPYIKSLNITAKAEEETLSKITISGNGNFRVGENIVTIRVTAQDGSTRDYKIIVTKEGSDINTLSSLSITPGTIDFEEDTNSYIVNVPYSVSRVTVSGEKSCSLSKVTGLGTYNLVSGTNTINVRVVSETGIPNTYTITVNRAYNTDATLKTLTVSNGTLSPTFASGIKEYTVNVDNTVSKITIGGTPTISTTSVTGRGTYNLNVGDNEFIIDTIAEDGISTDQYKIVITRDVSGNANLEYLNVKEGNLSPAFSPMVIGYTVKVPNEVTDVTVDYNVQDTGATAELNKTTPLVVGNNTVTVTVTAVNDSTKTYTINVIRQEEPINNLNLQSLEVTNCTINFDEDTTYYECEVDYDISQVVVTAEAVDSTNDVQGTGSKNLAVGKNVINVTVVNSIGQEKTYQVVITRKQSSDPRLSNIKITGHTLDEITFVPDNGTYHVTTKQKELEVIPVKKVEGQTVVISGNTNFVLGENTITVDVTSADGVNAKTYTIIVNKEKSDNNYLASLEVTNYNTAPMFNKETLDYYVTVENDVESISFTAEAEDENAVINNGAKVLVGNELLNKGENIIDIVVKAHDDTEKTYKLHVTKLGSRNNLLDSLVVSGYTLKPGFDPLTNTYSIDDVPYDVSELEIIASTQDENATISGDGIRNIAVGSNQIKITVVPEYGQTNTYIVNVNRNQPVTSKLKDIKVKNYDLDKDFDSDVTEYTVTVDFEIESLEFVITKLDPNSTYTISGNTNFEVGKENIVTIHSVSSDTEETTDYTIKVIKQAYSNTYLQSLALTNDEYIATLEPEFNKTTLTYNVTVPYEIDRITITALAEQANSTVTGTGEKTLNVGNNEFKIKVTSTGGVTRTYTVNVTRIGSNIADVLSITSNLGEVEKVDENNYTLKIQNDITEVTKDNFVVTASDKLAVVTKPESLDLTESMDYVITVVSPDGTVTSNYTVHISYIMSKDNSLKFINVIEPEGKTLKPTFNKDIRTYTLNVLDTQTQVEFEAEPTDEKASIQNSSLVFDLDDDYSTDLYIYVKAEDDTVENYKITVNKSLTYETNLQKVELLGVTDDSQVPNFEEDIHVYNVVVPFEVSEIEFDITKKNPGQKIKIYNISNEEVEECPLVIGDNKYVIEVENSFGTTDTYTYNIERLKSTNNWLASLKLTDPKYEFTEFYKAIYNYYVVVPNDCTSVTVEAIAEQPLYTYVDISGATYLSKGNNDISIKVYNAYNEERTYTIHVLRTPDINNLLQTLTVSSGDIYTLSPKFTPGINEYTLEVESVISQLKIDAIPYDENAKVKMTVKKRLNETQDTVYQSKEAMVALKVGENIINIDVTIGEGEDAATRTYTMNVTRKTGNNAYIESLIIRNGTLVGDFSKEKSNYTVNVGNNVTSLDMTIITEDPGAEYEVIGNSNFVYGENEVKIKVTSSEGSVSKTYTLTVNKEGDHNSKLDKLYINDELFEEFAPEVITYDIEVENIVDTADIRVETASEFATVTGNECYDLDVGINTIVVTVTAQDGESTTDYTLNITRKPNCYLSKININSVELVPFDKTIFAYTVQVEDDDTIEIEGIADDETNATVDGNRTYNLNIGDNTIKLKVTNGSDEKEYTITVNRKGSTNTYLEYLTIDNAVVEPTFVKTNREYTVKIPDNMTSLDMDYKPEDDTSTVAVSGNSGFNSTNHTVTITVTSTSGEHEDYILNVVREDYRYFSTKLISLAVDKGTLAPRFDMDNTEYTVTVPYNTEDITVSATAQTGYSKVTGTGTYELQDGRNAIEVKVTSRTGKEETYSVIVYRLTTANTYNITYVLNDGVNNENNPATYTHGIGTPLYDASKEYYTFGGWYTSATFDETKKIEQISDEMFGDITLYANFIPDEYNIKYYYGDEELDLTPKKYSYGVETELPSYDIERYAFGGWYKDPTFDEDSKVEVISETEHGDITLYAKQIADFGTIKGKIITKNYKNEHNSKITLYNHGDRTTPLKQITTEKDGSYNLEITDFDSKLDMVVTKDGYLKYTIENIEISKDQIVDVGTYNLVAGDVVSDGIIELDDLVYINEYYGTEITEENKEQLGRYDLNEDGIINKADRDLVIENLDAENETVAWETIVNPVVFSLFNDSEDEEEDTSTEEVSTNDENSTQETNEEENFEDDENDEEEINDGEEVFETKEMNTEVEE